MSKLQNVRAYLTGEGISHVDIEFENGIITSISPAKEGDVSSLPEDAVVLPGFIDQHVHGAGGSDTMDATPEALACISQTLAKWAILIDYLCGLDMTLTNGKQPKLL